MPLLLDIPAQVRVVDSLEELRRVRFEGKVNAAVYPRSLRLPFMRMAWALKLIEPCSYDRRELQVIGRIQERKGNISLAAAFHLVCDDLKRLNWRSIEHQGTSPAGARGDTTFFHEDVGTSRILCAYNVAATEWVRNEDAVRAPDGTYDLKSGAVIRSFGLHNVWRFAAGDDANVLPVVHRKPIFKTHAGRLLLDA